MNKYVKYLVAILIPIAVIIIMVITFNLVNGMLSRNAPKNNQPKEQVSDNQSKKPNLLDAPRNNQAVKYAIQGPISGNEQHNSIVFTIDRSKRRVEIVEGYSGKVIRSKDIANTQEAYKAFVDALNGAGFAAELKPDNRGTETQVCPLGYRYIFELNPGRSETIRTWANSCSSKQGTFGGNKQTVQILFKRQIPEYDKFISGIKL